MNKLLFKALLLLALAGQVSATEEEVDFDAEDAVEVVEPKGFVAQCKAHSKVLIGSSATVVTLALVGVAVWKREAIKNLFKEQATANPKETAANPEDKETPVTEDAENPTPEDDK